MPTDRMTFGSLFSGIGGLDLGLERAGMECAWQVEIDDYCTRVLERHWPGVTKHKDVRDVGKENLEPVDLIAGGFPCQPHSVAGKRRGAADDRNLWPEFIRVISETRPRYVLAENVPGIITTYLDTVLSDLEGEGYAPWPFSFSACGFDAPHRRERIFVVAHANGARELQPQGSKPNKRRWVGDESEDVAYAECRRRHSGGYSRKGNCTEREDNPQTRQQGRQQRTRSSANGSDVADTPSARLEGQEPAGIYRGEQGLSTECSWWTVEPDVGRVAHGVPSRVDRLRGLGNAVVPQVAEWIGRRIIEHAN